jgi:hypothetical protein
VPESIVAAGMLSSEVDRTACTAWLHERHAGPVSALNDNLAEAASALGALAVARGHRELRTPVSGSTHP